MTCAAVVLAAGGGLRFLASGGTGPKSLALLDGRALLDHVLASVEHVGFDEVVVVGGATDLSAWSNRSITVLHNHGWEAGIAAALAMALGYAHGQGYDSVVVGLADQPGVPAAAWRTVRQAADGPPIVVPVFAGRRGNPVRLHKSIWSLLPSTGDVGARLLMRACPELVVEVACEGDPTGIDTIHDLHGWTWLLDVATDKHATTKRRPHVLDPRITKGVPKREMQ